MIPPYQRIRCAVCGIVCEQRRRIVRVGVASHVALECIECEVVYVEPATRTDVPLERVESVRNFALEAKCDLLSASLRQAEAKLRDIHERGPERDAQQQLADLVRHARHWIATVSVEAEGLSGLAGILDEYDAKPASEP